MKTSLSFFVLMFSALLTNAQQDVNDLQLLQLRPRQYTVQRTTENIQVDGLDSETAWKAAMPMEPFMDIEGRSAVVPPFQTECKLLWDQDNLYVFARFQEKDIWANQKVHDQSVFSDNAFEIFMDPDGDTHNYMEFQINALGTVWDLFLNMPYRDGGAGLSGWDIKDLKKAVHVEGTLNKAYDSDKYWTVELAIPFRSLRFGRSGMPSPGDVWRMNFSRVEWEFDVSDQGYQRKKGPDGKLKEPSYYVWSPQGLVNLHYPEKWGYVRFADQGATGISFIDTRIEDLKQTLWKYYYLQQNFRRKEGRYAPGIEQLQRNLKGKSDSYERLLKLSASDKQFLIELEDPSSGTVFSIDQEGKQRQRKLM